MTAGRQSFAGKAAVAGVGMTELSRDSGRSVLELALEASRAAITDAGLGPQDVDAVLCYHMNDSTPAAYLASALHLQDPVWTNEFYSGGTQCASILGDAAMLIESGTASSVLVYRALNGRSGKRMGQTALRIGAGAEEQFSLPYGMLGPVHLFALAAQRWMHETGADESDLAAVVRHSRDHASRNPRAIFRKPMAREEYFGLPYVATPLRRADCCLESDGAVALLVTRTDIADAARPGSPRIRAAVRGGGPGASAMDRAPDVSRLFSSSLAAPLYERAGMSPADVDLAMVYDAYSFVVPVQLEDFGLVPPGESGAFLRAGAADFDGRLPVNPHGGLLSEGYVHGLNNIAEAVRQLRGDAVANQVRDPSVALCTGFGGSLGSAAILERV
ncbi:thiolase C-terminal domain-containing protein [Streptomyces spiralis]|uniref:thiolase C-terminal domain-containing protein n=1 Tax=Streptomyces spiralis TaxID=66376 RepID=UPI0033F115BA